ncbi:hypothetical protein [Nostoc sp. CCY0012]|uniref:hypothetical protein n=1 Tax=Nostoc sp. CCY0012 TaxID=1056123 RepID=UPI0039C5C529
MTKCKHRRGNVCDPPKKAELRCLTCPYRPNRRLEPVEYDPEDGLCYLDRTSPEEYEPEPILSSGNKDGYSPTMPTL